MRLMTSLWIVVLAASAAAQAPNTVQNTRDRLNNTQTPPASAQPTSQPSQLPYKPPAAQGAVKTSPVATATTPSAQVSTPSASANRPVKLKTKTAKKPAARVVRHKVQKKSEKGEPSVAEAAAANKEKGVVAGKRDPFVSPVVERTASGAPPGCVGGKKCLVAESLSLRGIVKSNGTLIAVVVTGENRAYFLRVNDPVYNGVVIKISDTSVVFREQGTDVLGKPITREVVKKINTQA